MQCITYKFPPLPLELAGFSLESTRQWSSQKRGKTHDRFRETPNSKRPSQQMDKSVHTIERYRCDGTGPVYLKIGGKVMYRLIDIEAFESERRFQRPDVQKPVPPKAVSVFMLHEAIARLS
jgi:hypothetical protein